MRNHELANLLPRMSKDEFTGLKGDIKRHGQREAVVLFEGRVLDGRHRWQACRELGITPTTKQFTGTWEQARDHVLSTNIHRRNLSESQRARLASKMAQLSHGGDRRSEQAAEVRVEKSTAAVAEQLSVSPRLVEQAKQLDREAPELGPAVDKGEMRIGTALKVAKLPEPLRQEAAKAGKVTPEVRAEMKAQTTPPKGAVEILPPGTVTPQQQLSPWERLEKAADELSRSAMFLRMESTPPPTHWRDRLAAGVAQSKLRELADLIPDPEAA